LSSTRNPIQEVEQLIINRNFKKAMSTVDELLKKPKTSKIKILELLLAKSHIFSELEQFNEGLILADEVLEESRKLDNKLLIVDAIIARLANLGVKEWWIGREINCSYLYYKSWDQLSQYSELINEGENILKTITSNKNLMKKREAQFLRMKGLIFREKDQHELSVQCFEKSMNYFLSIDNKNEVLQDLISISNTLFYIFDLVRLNDVLKKANKLNEEVKNDFFQAVINLIFVFYCEENIEVINKYYQNALQILTKLEDIRNIAWYNFEYGLLFTQYKGEFTTGLKYYNKGLALFETLNDHNGIAISLLRIGHANRLKGDFKQAFDYSFRSLAVCEQYDIKSDLVHTYTFIGKTHQILGNMDKALDFYNKSLKLSEQGFSDLISYTQMSLGEIYFAKNNFEKAKECFIDALKKTESIGVIATKAQIFFQLVVLSLESDSLTDAQNYFKNIKELAEEVRVVKIVNQYKLLAEALILKNSARLRDQFQALEMFQKVAQAKTTRFELTITALLNSCELLLLEIRTTNNEDIIREIELITDQLLDIAKGINSVFLFAETYILQSKLAIIALDFNKAERLFIQAKELAADKELQSIVSRIIDEQEAITKKIGGFKEFSKKDLTITERLNYIQINGNVDQMMKKNITGVLREQEENTALCRKLFSLKL